MPEHPMINDQKSFKNSEAVSLRDYFDDKIEALTRCFTVKFDAMESARNLAKEAVEAKLLLMNELRGALNDQSSRMLTRAEYQLQHDRLIEDIRILRESKALLEGKATQASVNLAYLIGFTGLLISVINLAHAFWSK
jgi:hypothetical protein